MELKRSRWTKKVSQCCCSCFFVFSLFLCRPRDTQNETHTHFECAICNNRAQPDVQFNSSAPEECSSFSASTKSIYLLCCVSQFLFRFAIHSGQVMHTLSNVPMWEPLRTCGASSFFLNSSLELLNVCPPALGPNAKPCECALLLRLKRMGEKKRGNTQSKQHNRTLLEIVEL